MITPAAKPEEKPETEADDKTVLDELAQDAGHKLDNVTAEDTMEIVDGEIVIKGKDGEEKANIAGLDIEAIARASM